MTDSLSQPLDIHIRVKRKNTVLFIYVDPSETVLELKEKIETLLGQPARDQRLKKKDKILENDEDKLSELGVEFDDELFLLYRLQGSEGWESVDPALLESSADAVAAKA